MATILLFATVNALVRGSRKNAANCDKHCDVRNSGNRQDFERILYLGFSRCISELVFEAPYEFFALCQNNCAVRYGLVPWRAIQFMVASLASLVW